MCESGGHARQGVIQHLWNGPPGTLPQSNQIHIEMHKKLKPPTKGPADEKSLFHTHKHHYCLGRWLHVLNAQKYGHYMLWQSDQWHFRAGEWASVGRVLWTIMAPLLGKQASWLQSQEVDGLLKCSRRAGRAQWEGVEVKIYMYFKDSPKGNTLSIPFCSCQTQAADGYEESGCLLRRVTRTL